jgi:DNA-3-methyladenine glycosylase II
MRALTTRGIRTAAAALAAADPALAASLTRWGPPPLWARAPGFATLVHLILEQQVSLASAQAAFDRLHATLAGRVEPAPFLALDDAALLAIGFSRQKAGYARDLAAALSDGFDLDALARLDDDAVRARLTSLRGIGTWTADIYLLMVLRRPDIWPHGDLALVTAATELLGLPERPSFEELGAIAERWAPHRATAARMCWHHYLSVRGRS